MSSGVKNGNKLAVKLQFYLLSLVCRSLELETYSRFSHEQLFVEESRESFVQSVIKVGYKVEW